MQNEKQPLLLLVFLGCCQIKSYVATYLSFGLSAVMLINLKNAISNKTVMLVKCFTMIYNTSMLLKITSYILEILLKCFFSVLACPPEFGEEEGSWLVSDKDKEVGAETK